MTNCGNDILKLFEGLIKQILEKMIREERAIYLQEHPETKGNGFYTRDLFTGLGVIEEMAVARSRDGKFKSTLLPERTRHSVDLARLIQSLIVAGVSSRRLGEVLKNIYGMEMSHSTISSLSEVASDEIQSWRMRAIASHYAVIILDATYFPLKRESVEKEAIYIATGIRPDGCRDVLGYWIPGGNESAYNWEEIIEELKQRGLEQVDFVVADGLTGLKSLVNRTLPDARFQSCVLHMLRSTMHKVRARDREAIAADLKMIYRAESDSNARENFGVFEKKWQSIYPKVVKSWQAHLEDLLSFMQLPKPLWGYVYTNNSLERMMKEIKRRLKTMEVLQSEASAEKFLYLLLKERNEKYNRRKLRNWQFYYQHYLEERVHRHLQTQLT